MEDSQFSPTLNSNRNFKKLVSCRKIGLIYDNLFLLATAIADVMPIGKAILLKFRQAIGYDCVVLSIFI